MKHLEIGCYSDGTMKVEDVFSAIQGFLPKEIVKEFWKEYEAGNIESCEFILNEEAWDRMNDMCPPYCYFGGHEGDGACYGVWVDFDTIEEDVRNGCIISVSDLSEVPGDYVGFVILVNDHGNMTLYSKTSRTLKEVWSVV